MQTVQEKLSRPSGEQLAERKGATVTISLESLYALDKETGLTIVENVFSPG